MQGRLLIADDQLASPAKSASESIERERSRLGAALASPRGVLLTVPLLVAVVGVTLTLVGQSALEQTSLSMARERFAEQTSFTSHRIAEALEEAEPVLDRLRELAQSRASSDAGTEIANVLRDLTTGRPGMAQAYVAYPDGTFQGVYLAGDGAVHFQESRIGPHGGRSRHYTYTSTGLSLEREEQTEYDPRQRAYYKAALEQRKRTWTAPYPFFTTQHTGVTRVEPIFASGGELHAVIAADFDASELSAFMARAEHPDVHELVFADDGVILAYPSEKERIRTLKRTGHALNYRDIGDPLLTAFFMHLPAAGAELSEGFARFEAGDERMLATVATIGGATGPGWRVAVLASEASTLRALAKHRLQSLLIAAGALLAALVAAWFFARHIVRARRAVAVARAKADEASRKVTELGSYELVECLGKGGMGEVWRARHRLLAREAAIKLIGANLLDGVDRSEVNERFKREAQTIARLRSRNTVEVFDYGVTSGGTFFYVMELLDGIDLETMTDKYGPQPASRVVQLLVQACNSLAEAHDAGLVHRDIKPANIFVCRAAEEVDVVKILDFGLVLAKSDDKAEASAAALGHAVTQMSVGRGLGSARLTSQGSYLGTPTFIAPEQALGEEIDHRADLYALGCVAWWLLTGRLVFENDDALAALTAHITQDPPPLRPLVPGSLPEELEQLIGRCLLKQPAQRPASARELAQALRRIRFDSSEDWTADQGQVWWRERVVVVKEHAIGTMPTVLSNEGGLRLRPWES
ncbi:MAG: serine/threonine protein kinase [Pseudomonadota bacterium]